jgi:hypothetical protein
MTFVCQRKSSYETIFALVVGFSCRDRRRIRRGAGRRFGDDAGRRHGIAEFVDDPTGDRDASPETDFDVLIGERRHHFATLIAGLAGDHAVAARWNRQRKVSVAIGQHDRRPLGCGRKRDSSVDDRLTCLISDHASADGDGRGSRLVAGPLRSDRQRDRAEDQGGGGHARHVPSDDRRAVPASGPGVLCVDGPCASPIPESRWQMCSRGLQGTARDFPQESRTCEDRRGLGGTHNRPQTSRRPRPAEARSRRAFFRSPLVNADRCVSMPCRHS